MDIFDYQIKKEDHMKKIIEDTEELISNLKDNSKIVIKNYSTSSIPEEDKSDLMYKLGQNIINYRDNIEENLGNTQVSLI